MPLYSTSAHTVRATVKRMKYSPVPVADTATHAVFSEVTAENLASANFEQVVVTDTIPIRPDAPDNVRVLSCADILTDSIRSIFTDGSVSELFAGENQLF